MNHACTSFAETGCVVPGTQKAGPKRRRINEIVPAQENPEKGYENCGEGYFDIAYQGVANDFCRWVGSCGCRGTCSWWSCALAGSNQQYSADGVYQENQFSGPYSQGETVNLAEDPYTMTISVDYQALTNETFYVEEIFAQEDLHKMETEIEKLLKDNGINLNDYVNSIIWHPYPAIDEEQGTVNLTVILVPVEDNHATFSTDLQSHINNITAALTSYLGHPTTVGIGAYESPAAKKNSYEDPHFPIVINDDIVDDNNSEEDITTGQIVAIVFGVIAFIILIALAIKFCICTQAKNTSGLDKPFIAETDAPYTQLQTRA